MEHKEHIMEAMECMKEAMNYMRLAMGEGKSKDEEYGKTPKETSKNKTMMMMKKRGKME